MISKNDNHQFRSFTIESHSDKFRSLITDIGISLPFIPSPLLPNSTHPIIETKALWDTGATNCAITPKTVEELKLKPIGKVTVAHANGKSDDVNVYLVNIYLPNNIIIPNIRVSECKNESDDFGVLIGMDVITFGDFSITNVDGKSTFSFRIPSVKKIDYTKELPVPKEPIVKPKELGRNDICHCGSGKKYKNCHGQGK